MARRKRIKTSKTKRISLKSTPSKRRSGRKNTLYPSVTRIIKVFAVACLSAAMGIGFILVVWFGFTSMEKYVINNVPVWEKVTALKLIGVPTWVTGQLKTKVYAAAAPDGDLIPNEESARMVQRNLSQGLAWLDEVRVQTTHESINVEGRWRRPLVLVKSSLNKFYVDSEMVVLDYVPLPNLPIVKVEGLQLIMKTPPPGSIFQRDDLLAAVAILARLERMDRLVTPDKPLLYEIASVDVSNFKGLENSRFPHIVLYTTDNTEIIWGAEVGTWQQHLESTDEQKLAKLYEYYKKHGSLLGGVKYINLRDPQDNIPLPIDKY